MPNEREPCEICSNCWIKLSDFHEYYQSITEAQKVLKHKILPTESEKEPLFITDYIEVKHDCDNVIKEEFLDDTSRNSITNDFLETEDPFEELATDDNKKQSKNTTNKYAKCNPIKRAKRKNLPRRKKIKIAETNSENEESEELKPLSVLLEDIKREDANANISKRGKPRTIESKCGRQKSTNDIIRRRKGLTLLEENNALIKKHIKMLCQMCPHTSNDFQELIKHFKEEHLDIKPHIKCCDRKLDCPSDILQHAFYHENPEHFKCSECEKTFINKSGLRDHYMQYHEPEENLPYGCDHCPRRFSRKNVLEHHRSKHVPITERSHYCNICQPPRA